MVEEFPVVVGRVDLVGHSALRLGEVKRLVRKDRHQKKPCGLRAGEVECLLAEKVEVVELSWKLDAHGGHVRGPVLFLHRAEAVQSPEGTAAGRAAERDELIRLLDRTSQQGSEEPLFIQIFQVHVMVYGNLPAAAAVEGAVGAGAPEFV